MADELPPVVTRLTADVQGLADGLVKGKALVQAFKQEVAAEFGGGLPIGERLGSDIGDGIGRGIQDSAPGIQDQVKDKIKDPVTKAGKDSGLAFSTQFRDSLGQSLSASPVLRDTLIRDATDKGRGAGAGFSVSFKDSVKENLTESTVASILDPSGPVGQKLTDGGKKSGADAGKAAGGSFLANASPLLVGAFAAAATAGPALILGGAATAVFGVEALVTHSNTNLAGSYQQLAQDANAAIDKATEPLVPQMQASLNVLDQGIGKIGPELKDTFAAVAPDATQITSGLVSLVSNTLPGLNQGLKDIQPEIHVISDDFGKLGNGLGGFVAGLGQGAGGGTAGFDALITAVEHLLPDLGRVVGDLSNGLGPALHDVESVAVPVANALADVADALPPGVIRGTADAVAALYAAFKIGTLTGAIQEGTTFTAWLRGTKIAAAETATEVTALGTAEEATAAKGGAMAAAAGVNAKAFAGLGTALDVATGPLGLLIGGAGLLGNELGNLAGVGEHVTLDVQQFASTLAQAASGTYAAQQQVNVLASSVDFMQAAIGKGSGTLDQMDAALVQLFQSNPAQAAQDFQALSDAFSKDGKSASDVANMLPGYTKAVKDAALASQQMGIAQGQALGPAQSLTQAIVTQQEKSAQSAHDAGLAAVTVLDLGSAQTTLEQSLIDSVNGYDSAKTAAGAYDQVLTALNGTTSTLLGSEASFTIALDGVAKAAQANGTSLDVNNAKGAQNIQTFTQLATSAQKAATAVYENEVNTKGATIAFNDANSKLAAEKAAFEAAAEKAGFNKIAVQQLADELFHLPHDIPVSVDITSAQDQVNHLVRWIDSQSGTITIQTQTGSGVSYNPKSGGGKALYDYGGWTKAAPGQPEEAIVHGGEYMLSADMLAGRQPVDARVLASLRASLAGVGVSGGGSGPAGFGGAPGSSGGVTVIAPIYLDGRMIGQATTTGTRAGAQQFARYNAITGLAGNYS